MAEIPYKLKPKGLLSKADPAVVFECPACRTELNAPAKDAGKPDRCPQCDVPFVTPGMAVLDGMRAAEERRRREHEERIAAEAEERAKAGEALAHDLARITREREAETAREQSPDDAAPVTVGDLKRMLERRPIAAGTFGRTALACMAGSLCTSLLVGGLWGLIVGLNLQVGSIAVGGGITLGLGILMFFMLVAGADAGARAGRK